jgi:hypothetical protein
MKAALTIGFTTASSWKLWGKASAVGERTYGPTPSLVGDDASSFQVEDLAIGVKSGKALSSLDHARCQLPDWGTWWQGEIAGEYFLANSNLRSHLVRVHLTPSKTLGTGLLI